MKPTSSLPGLPAVLLEAARDSYLVVLTFVVLFTGVGQLSARAGLDWIQTAVMTALTLAAPAQAAAMSILIAANGAGGAWIAAIVAVGVVNLRFAVMVASVMARLPRMSIPRTVAALGLLSASSFAVIFPRLIGGDPPRRPALYAGCLCALCCVSAVCGAVAGHSMSTAIPPLAAAALSALLPVYFATLIAVQWRNRILMVNAVLGAILVPLASPLLGSSSLLVVPLAVAVAGVLLPRRRKPHES